MSVSTNVRPSMQGLSFYKQRRIRYQNFEKIKRDKSPKTQFQEFSLKAVSITCHRNINLFSSFSQQQVLESRLEDLQKQHDSLSQAHNSLEQLNSSWSEKSMEQRTKIEAMIKEDEELGKRLNQTEETLEKMRETNKQLEHSLQTEVCKLGVKSNVRLNPAYLCYFSIYTA